MRAKPIFSEKDEKRIERLYTDNRKRMYRVALHILGEPQLSEDAVQESFCKILGMLHRFQWLSDAQAASFCATVCKNTALNMRKKEARTASTEDVEQFLEGFGCSAEDAALKHMEGERVRELVRTLPSEDREILSLYYDSGYRIKEIAEFLNITADAAKKRLQRARGKLKALFPLLLVCLLLLPGSPVRGQLGEKIGSHGSTPDDGLWQETDGAEENFKLHCKIERIFLPAALPDGFSFVSRTFTGDTIRTRYASADGKEILFAQSGAAADMNAFGTVAETIVRAGTVIFVFTAEETTVLYWEEDGVFFTVTGQLPPKELLPACEVK